MKSIVLLIISALICCVIYINCDSNKDEVICDAVFKSVGLYLKYPDGQPVILDSCKVFWVDENRFLENHFQEMIPLNGIYIIVDDGMRKELKDRQELMRFTGYLNGEIIYEKEVLVSADPCHVFNFETGTEMIVQVISGIPDIVRDSKFCEYVNVEQIRNIIPSINYFVSSIDENLSYEIKLQMMVDWLLSHSCITDARIDYIEGFPNDSRITFSFVENGQTVDMIMISSVNPFSVGLIWWK